METSKNDLYVLSFQMLSQIGYLSYWLQINYLRVPQTQQQRRVSFIAAMLVDGDVDGFEVLVEVHVADWT